MFFIFSYLAGQQNNKLIYWMNVPVHDYMTYKKESSLGYFASIQPKNHSLKDQNEVYQTMKSFYLISKIFRSFNNNNNKDGNKRIKLNVRTAPKRLPTLQSGLARQQMHTKTQFKSTTSLLDTLGQESLYKTKRKSFSINYQRTKTQIQDIKTRAERIYSKLNNNRNQVRLVANYNNLLDTYFDKIPSPTASVTRQAIQEQQKFNKLCKQDIFLQMNRDRIRSEKKMVEEFYQPEIPEPVMEKLIRKNRQELEDEKHRRELRNNNKIRIKQKFLSCFRYGKEAQKIAERSKSQGLINVSANI